MFDLHAIQEEVDFSEYKDEPVRIVRKNLASFQLSEANTLYTSLKIRQSQVLMRDSDLPIWSGEEEYAYVGFEPDKQQSVNLQLDEEDVEVLAHITSDLRREKFVYRRQTYNLLGLVSDLGGLMLILWLIISTLISLFVEHSFTLKAIKKLYKARTAENFLLPNSNGMKFREKAMKTEAQYL